MTIPSEYVLLRVAEVSGWLNVSKSTIYKWVKDGTFPSPIILGEEVSAKNHASRWVKSEIEEWLDARPRGKHDQ